MRVEPLTSEHCAALADHVQVWQRGEAHLLRDPGFAAGVVSSGPAHAIVSPVRGVVVVGGALDLGGGRASMWAFFSSRVQTAMTGVVRLTLREMDTWDFRRIELVTHAQFGAAQRLALLLGFDFEAVLRAWYPPVPDLNLPSENGWMFARIACPR